MFQTLLLQQGISVERSFISDEKTKGEAKQRRELNISAEEKMEAVEQKSG